MVCKSISIFASHFFIKYYSKSFKWSLKRFKRNNVTTYDYLWAGDLRIYDVVLIRLWEASVKKQSILNKVRQNSRAANFGAGGDSLWGDLLSTGELTSLVLCPPIHPSNENPALYISLCGLLLAVLLYPALNMYTMKENVAPKVYTLKLENEHGRFLNLIIASFL